MLNFFTRRRLLIFTLIGLLALAGFLYFKSGARAATAILRPTAHTDSATKTTNPENAHDSTATSTYAQTDYTIDAFPSITWHTFDTSVTDLSNVYIKIIYSATAGSNDDYVIYYSTTGCGGAVTVLVATSTAAAATTTVSSANLGSFDSAANFCVRIDTNRDSGADAGPPAVRMHDIWAEATYTPTLTIGATSASTTPTLNSGGTGQYANSITCAASSTCAAFTITPSFATTLTSIKLTETGTVNAARDLGNVMLYYNTDGNFTTGTSAFGTSSAQFISGDTVTLNGSLALTGGNTYYFYVGFDLASSTDASSTPTGGWTIGWQIAAAADVTASGSPTISGTPATLVGTSMVKPVISSYANVTEGVLDYKVILSDGANWTQATASSSWAKRNGHTSLVYDNKMWVMGGSGSTYYNDVWYSTDGANWTQATSSAAWPVRYAHTSVVYDNKMWVLGGYNGANLLNDVWYSTDGANWTQATASSSWAKRESFTSLVYDNKMWVLGGEIGSGIYLNDVWYSTDGANWTQATAASSWSVRYNHSSLVYDNKMWVLGGSFGSFNQGNDVWYSTDGANWTQATSSAAWPVRYAHTSVVYDNKMWVLGGRYSDEVPPPASKKDVWYSTDGANWTQATSSAAWPARGHHTSLVYDGKMWVMGGLTGNSAFFNDVWYSTITSTCTTCGARLGAGSGKRQTITISGYGFGYDPGLGSRDSVTNKIEIGDYGYINTLTDDGSADTNVLSWSTTSITIRTDLNISGNADTDWGDNYGGPNALSLTVGGARSSELPFYFFPQISSITSVGTDAAREYSSADSDGVITLNGSRFGYNTLSSGANWTQATASSSWAKRNTYTSFVYTNKMWVMGGNNGAVRLNDVWYSTDGANWTQATASSSWAKRNEHTSVVYNNKMWIIGGYNNPTYYNNAWYSTDGANWTQATASSSWAKRSRHSSVVYNNKMWVIGGYNGNYFNDIWYSTDGANWTQATTSSSWAKRQGHSSVVYNNKMWVMGGVDSGGGYLNDVWYSTDGANWTQATTSSSWAKRFRHSSVVYNNKMWVMGGVDSGGGYLNDVWYSTDGASWTQATASSSWAKRQAHTSVVYNHKMWVMGGDDGAVRLNDVWYSDLDTSTSSPWARVLGCDASTCSSPTGSATTTSWTSGAITLQVPTVIANNAYTGDITVQSWLGGNFDTTIYATTTYGTTFRILPRITSFVPDSGSRGASITIAGDHFCQYNDGTCPSAFNATSSVVFNASQPSTVFTSWSDTLVVTAVPASADTLTGPVVVNSNNYTSNGPLFTLLGNPTMYKYQGNISHQGAIALSAPCVSLYDPRDGKTYKTVQIGSQCWMKQGLNIGTRVNGGTAQGTTCASAADIEKWCYSDSDANCDTNKNPNYPDGGLYRWSQAMCGAASCNGTGESQPACSTPVQGICPAGWHIPSHYELNVLERAICTSGSCAADFPFDTTTTGLRGTNEGTKLKPNGSSGFEGNLTGHYLSGFDSRGTITSVWSSSQYDASNAFKRRLETSLTTVSRTEGDKFYGFTVRCLKN